MHLIWEEKVTQKLRSIHPPAVACIYIVCNLTDYLDNLFVFIKLDTFLTVVTHNDSFAQFDTSSIRLYISVDNIKQGTLACAIRSQNTDFLSLSKLIAKVPNKSFTIKAF